MVFASDSCSNEGALRFPQQPLPHYAARDPRARCLQNPKTSGCFFHFLARSLRCSSRRSHQPPVTSLHLRQSIFLRQPAALEEGRRKKKNSFITADVRARRHGNTAQKFSHCDSIQSSVSGLRCLNLKCCVCVRVRACVEEPGSESSDRHSPGL